MRETLLGELEDNSGVRPEPAVRVAGRRAPARGRRPIEPVAAVADGDGENHERQAKACKHGVPKGWRCWQCGGQAIIE
jgi:hypothetical protein